MLHSYPRLPETEGSVRPDAVWVDLVNPTEAEIRTVEQATGLPVPTFSDLSEIQTSSRLQRAGSALVMSMPGLPQHIETGTESPIGFVLSRERLITVRFAHLPSFEQVTEMCHAGTDPARDGLDVLLLLFEAMIDRFADLLEEQGALLDRASRRIFHPGHRARQNASVMGKKLRGALQEVGSAGDLTSKIRDTLLGVARILPFAEANTAEWSTPQQKIRLSSLRSDVHSLGEYDEHLASKVQFLLDATMGFLNLEQNNIFRLLTIVSIVGIPPTFVASLYGMNFEHIPELHWRFGYHYALVLMVVTAVLPLVWFRVRGWL